MAKKILTDLNLRQNELQNVVFQHLTVAPESPKEGQVYFNTDTHKFNVYENGAWVTYATTAEVAAALALKLDASVFESYKSTNDAAVASKVAQTAYDAKVKEIEDALAEKAVKTEVQAALDKKVETSAYDAKVQELQGSIDAKVAQTAYDAKIKEIEDELDTKADAEGMTAELAKKVDKETYATDKTNLEAAIATKVAQTTYDAKVQELEAADAANAKAVEDLDAEITEALGGKADKATTLAGYGIADAYTKEEVDAKVASVYRFKGSVETFDALPTEGLVEGDVYNVKATGENYAWVAPAAGEEAGHWDDLGGDVDLTPYATKEEVAATYETIANVAAIKEELEAAIEDVRGEAGEGAAGATHKSSFTNEELTPVAGVVTWTIVHTYGADVNVILKEVATGEEVIAEILQANNTVTVRMNAESVVAANTYKAVIIG